MGEWKLQVDGVWKDFDDDYGFKVKSWPGTGHSPVINRSTNYALQDGALFTGQKMGIRTFTLVGAFYGSSTLAAFHDQRQALIKALSSRTVKINQKPATIKIKYTGGTVDKEIDCIYEGGLELAEFVPFIENNVPIRFTAFNPQWNATSDTVVSLDTEDSENYDYSMGRVNDVWGDLGGGANASMKDIAINPSNGDIYFSGYFTNIGGSSANRIAKYDGSSWSALGTGLNSNGNSIVIDAASNIYVGGSFTTAGGGGANYIAKWDGSSWSALGTGLNAACNACAIDSSGNIYVGGSFTTAGGGGANYIAKWDGSSWSALGTGLNAQVYALAVDSNDNVYVGGQFTTAGGGAASYVAKWNGSSWSALGSGFNINYVRALAVDANDNVYAGGGFTSSGGSPMTYVAKWNGSSWSAVDGGFNANCYSLFVSSDGSVYAGGDFSDYGRAARLVNGSWVNAGATFTQRVIRLIEYDDNLYVGKATSSTDTFPGNATISYPGTEICYPIVSIKRSGGSSADLVSLVNAEISASILFDYSLLDGETLTVDFRPGYRSVTSSFYGTKFDAILDGSDFSSWYLQPGNASTSNDNVIVARVIATGSPTITANLTYRTAYRSLD